MSELINTPRCNHSFRWQFLAGASAAALVATTYGADAAPDAGSDHPTIWIELGGQLERVDSGQELFVPPFMNAVPAPLVSPVGAENISSSSFGGEGKISFEPDGTDWVFSAGVRFGRSNGRKHVHQQTKPSPIKFHGAYTKYFTPSNARFADANVSQSESHTIVDFTVGKDVGLGMFGRGSASVFNVGVRFAQFGSKSADTLGLDPSPVAYKYVPYFGGVNLPENAPHTFLGSIQTARSFHGFGPSASWDASLPFAGNPESSEFTFDWGLNAAVLIGRQKARKHRQTTERYYNPIGSSAGPNPHHIVQIVYQHTAPVPDRSRSVAVPNVGGFAGVSLKFPNAKVSLGYRADFFFGAMDSGINTRKVEDIGFHGPFATISIGFGG